MNTSVPISIAANVPAMTKTGRRDFQGRIDELWKKSGEKESALGFVSAESAPCPEQRPACSGASRHRGLRYLSRATANLNAEPNEIGASDPTSTP